jgi:hypothetical protein
MPRCAGRAAAALAAAALVCCAADAASPIVIRHERSYRLAEGAPPFRFVLEARGPEIEALDVRLMIYDAGETLRYRTEWPSGRYVMCESDGCALDSLSPAARDSTVRRELADLLSDAALAPGTPGAHVASASTGWWADSSLLPEVRRLLARQLWLLARGRGTHDEISEADADSLERERPALRERVALLVQELRGQPVFTYSTGALGYCTLAWSARERAIFDIDCVW